jgi:S-DNA-T family DNA segregation ATPase FtsK/SpoIIIE
MSPSATAGSKATDKELRATAQLIEQTLATFDIPARVETWVAGPTVTLFEVKIAKGVKVNRVTALSDDLALALAAQTVRVLAPIPGKSLIGIEVPNERRTTVTLGDVLVGAQLPETSPLMLGVGKDVGGERIVLDLAGMPHLLIAGSTGTGKSVCINALLVTLIMRTTPAEVRLILIDPKRIELSLYNEVPHLYVPVVTEAKEAASALAWAVSEMESRLRRLQKAGARNIATYNALAHEGKLPEGAEAMPYIVIVIDELADLMMVAAREVEDSICRLAQLARAAGIHLVVATQRPSTDIITGLIKTNITHRIAFMVGSSIDSRVILDQTGAERLVGLGDMLLSTPALAKAKRIQGAYVTEDEIRAVVEHLKKQAEPDYHEEILHLKVAAVGGGIETDDGDDDPLLWEAADIVVTSRIGSTSLLQRRLKVGYARAGRIMDMLEAKGIVGAPDGSKPRDVLADIEELESVKAYSRHDTQEEE